jgi:hypothetical protein
VLVTAIGTGARLPNVASFEAIGHDAITSPNARTIRASRLPRLPIEPPSANPYVAESRPLDDRIGRLGPSVLTFTALPRFIQAEPYTLHHLGCAQAQQSAKPSRSQIFIETL